MDKLTQLKKAPVAVIKANLACCGDTVMVSFLIGLLFFTAEHVARRHGLDERFISPFTDVIKGQLDILSVVVFYSVVVAYAGVYLMLSNVGFIQPLLKFLNVDGKMDVFYLFVLQCVAAAVGVRTGVFCVKFIASGHCPEGGRNIGILSASAIGLIAIWYIKGATGKLQSFFTGSILIALAAALYLSLAFSLIQKVVGA